MAKRRADERAIKGVELKIARAFAHLTYLDREITAFNGRLVARKRLIRQEVHDGGARHLLRSEVDLPVDWGVRLGEAVHNMRSALDNIVYQLIVDNTGRLPVTMSAFPISRSKGHFVSQGTASIAGVGPGPRGLIEKVQPFRRGPEALKPARMALKGIDDLWNSDKHRLASPWGIRLDTPALGLRESVAGSCTLEVKPGIHQAGEILMRIVCDPPDPAATVTGDVTLTAATRHAYRRRSGMNLREMFVNVKAVAQALHGSIGCQEREISHFALPAPGVARAK